MIFICLLLLICIFALISFAKSSTIKGMIGELIVQKQAKRLGKEYHLFNDYLMPDGEQGTTQIDHILLSPYGIFVIETKNYKGWIFGNEQQRQWTQQIFKQTYTFQNPLHQNYKHIKVLEKILADIVQPNVFHSIIVFNSRCEFKTVMPKNVCHGEAWLVYVKHYQKKLISDIQLKRIKKRLNQARLENTWKNRQAHIRYVKNKKD